MTARVRTHLAAGLVVAVLGVLAAGCGGGGGSSSTIGPVRPWLVTRGQNFVDRGGTPVMLHGVDVLLGKTAAYTDAPRLGVDFVRLAVPWSVIEDQAPMNGTRRWNEARLATLDREVQFFEAHRISVLIDFHQNRWSPYFGRGQGVPAWYYADGRFSSGQINEAEAAFWTTERRRSQAAFIPFATMMARRYSAYPNVIGFEIFNEPKPGSLGETDSATDAMLSWQAPVRRAIAAVDGGRTVFVMCSGGGNGVGTANLSLLGSPEHLALDFHDYFNGLPDAGLGPQGDAWTPSWKATHNQTTAAYTGTAAAQQSVLEVPIRTASRFHVPLLIGEWGIPTSSPGAGAYQAQMLHLMAVDHLNWARWVLGSSKNQFGILPNDPGASGALSAQLSAAASDG